MASSKRGEVGFEFVAGGPGHVGEFVGDGLGGGAGFGADEGRKTEVGYVEPGLHREQRDVQGAAVGFHAAAGGHDGVERRAVGAGVDRADQEGAAGHRHGGHFSAVQDFDHEPGEAFAGLIHVDMRVFPVADEDGVRLQHAGADVAVQIERDADRDAGHGDADAFEEFAFGVGFVLQHHGAVQGQENAVERGFAVGGDQAVDQFAAEGFEGGARDRAAGEGGGGEGGDGGDVRFGEHREIARDFGAGVAEFGEDFGSAADVEMFEVCDLGGDREEGVGFLAQSADGDAHFYISCSAWATASRVASMTASSCSVDRNQTPRSRARTPWRSRAAVKAM